jgi:hypothetical protein
MSSNPIFQRSLYSQILLLVRQDLLDLRSFKCICHEHWSWIPEFRDPSSDMMEPEIRVLSEGLWISHSSSDNKPEIRVTSIFVASSCWHVIRQDRCYRLKGRIHEVGIRSTKSEEERISNFDHLPTHDGTEPCVNNMKPLDPSSTWWNPELVCYHYSQPPVAATQSEDGFRSKWLLKVASTQSHVSFRIPWLSVHLWDDGTGIA